MTILTTFAQVAEVDGLIADIQIDVDRIYNGCVPSEWVEVYVWPNQMFKVELSRPVLTKVLAVA